MLVASSLLLTALATAPTIAMNGHIPSTADSASMAALGARTVRMDFNWFDFEPTSSSWNWGYLDQSVDGARANGLTIYATVAYTPQWASTVPGCDPNSSDDTAKCMNKVPDTTAWTNAVTTVVTRYRGRVECWGIWNEPNLRTFFDGNIDAFINQIFLPAANAIRAADPTGKICGPELAGLAASSNWNGHNGTCIFNSCIRNGWELDLGQMLNRVGSHIDIVTHHSYKADAAGIMSNLLDQEITAGVVVHDSVRNVLDANGAANKEFWLTETGWEHPPQGSMSLPDVATRIVDLYAKQEEVCAGTYAASTRDPWPNWTRTFYFHFPYDPGSGWGIVDPNQVPLAPYSALQNWASGRTTSACVAPGTDAGVVDAGVPDAGRPDSGVPDAGVAPDSGVPDAGTTPDSGTTPDAGAPDAAVTADSGVPDAGAPVDSGHPSPDGGAADGGGTGTEPPTGCGCASADGLAAFFPLVIALLSRRRRG